MKKITYFLPLFTAWAIQPVSPNFSSENLIVTIPGNSNFHLSNRTAVTDYFTESSY